MLHTVVLAERCMVKMVYMTRGGHVLAHDQLPGSPRYHSCRLCSGVLQMGFGRHAEHAVVAHTHSCFRPLQNCGQCEECWAEVHHRSVDMLAALIAAPSFEGRCIIRVSGFGIIDASRIEPRVVHGLAFAQTAHSRERHGQLQLD